MQEMVELSKQQSSDTLPQTVRFSSGGDSVTLNAGPAHFGRQLSGTDQVNMCRNYTKHLLKVSGNETSTLVAMITHTYMWQ